MHDGHGQDASTDVAEDHPLEPGQHQGTAYRDTVQHIITHEAHTGSTHQVQDVVLGFAQDVAEGLYVTNVEGELEWVEPDTANCHLMVAVMDAEDNRFIPYCDVQATLFDQDGGEYGPYDLPFIWHPTFYHYGRNLEIPGDGIYNLRINVNPLMFHRHDRDAGKRYTHPVEVVFQNAPFTTGRR